MATDHNFKVKNGLTVQGATLVVNHTGDLSDTQVYIKRKDSNTNLMRWGEGTSGQSTYRFRIDQNFEFIGNSGSGDNIRLKSSDGSIDGLFYKLAGTTVIDSSRNLTNIGTISSSYLNTTSGGVVSISTDGSSYASGMSRGALEIGSTARNYRYTSGWSGSMQSGILANTSEDWEFMVHDAGDALGSIFVYESANNAAGLIRFGRNAGYGVSNAVFEGTITSGAITSDGRLDITTDSSISEAYAALGITSTTTSAGLFLYGSGGRKYEIQSTGSNELIFYDRTSDVYRARIMANGNFKIESGALQLGSTTVIDSSRNLTNIGTISSGAITASSTIANVSSGHAYLILKNGGSHESGMILQKGSANKWEAPYISNANDNLKFYSYTSSGLQMEIRDGVNDNGGTIVSGFKVTDGNAYYGNYGAVLLNSSQNYTSSSRGWMVTNAYEANKFALLYSNSATTLPALTTAGAAASGTSVALEINNSGNATFAGTLSSGGDIDAGGRVKVTNWLELESAGAANTTEEAGIRFDYNDSPLWYIYKDNANDAALHIQSAGASGEGDGTPRVRFNRTARETYFGGAVGINQYSITSGTALDVSGNVRISGNLDVDGIIDNTRNSGNVAAPNTSDHTAGTRISFYDTSATAWYAMGIESDTLWFNSDDNYKWYQDAALRMSLIGDYLTVNGNFNAVGNIELDSHTFVQQTEYTGTSIFSQSGDWYTLAQITEQTTPGYFALKFGAHSTVTFSVTTGYVGSNVATINVLGSTWTQNGGYPGASELRIVKQTDNNNYYVQMRLIYSTGPTGFSLFARTWGGTPSNGTPGLVSSLSAYSATHTTIAHVYTNYNGTGSSTAHYNNNGSNTYPSYSFSGDTNTGMYRDTADSIGFATNGTLRTTISNSGLDVRSGTLKINGTDVIDSSRNVIAASFRPSVNNAWKIRGNNGNANLAFEYSTSSSLADANIKFELTPSRAELNGDLYFTKSPDPRIYAGSNVGLNIDGQALYLNRNSNSNILVGSGSAPATLSGLNVHMGGSSYVLASDGTRSAFMGADSSGYAMFGSLTNHDVVIRTNNAERVRVATNGNVTFKGDTFTFHGSGSDTYTSTALYINQTYGVLLEGSLQSNSSGAAKNPLVFTWRGNWNTQGGIKVEAGKTTVDSLAIKTGNSSTTVIDSSRNLTNIGSISSGFIAASGYRVGDDYAIMKFQTPYFTHGTSNLACDLILGNDYVNTVLEIEITGGYSNQNATGLIRRRWYVGLNPNGSIWQTPITIDETIEGPIASQLFVSDPFWDSSASTYKIRIYKKNSSGNAFQVLIKYLSNDAADALATNASMSGLLTNTSTTSSHSVGTNAYSGYRVNGTTVIDSSLNIGAGGAADSSYDLKVYGLARFEGVANFTNNVQVGGQTVIDSSRNLRNVTAHATDAEYGQSMVGNFGQWLAHSRYASSPGFNTDVDYWGWNFVQGNINAPHTSSSQWYRNRVSLGNQYGHGSASGDYWLEMAYARTTSVTGQMYIRACESGTIGSWHEVGANIRGNQYVGGSITAASNITAYSDERLKSNIQTLDGSKVLQMRGVSFTKNEEAGSGVIAQELEKIAPELVHDNEDGYKSVAYGNLTGYLIEAIKEQQEKIEKLEELVQKLISEK